ncbi:MAG: hypothetical protein Kow0069_16140 [Promethearchaeota archaeon]
MVSLKSIKATLWTTRRGKATLVSGVLAVAGVVALVVLTVAPDPGNPYEIEYGTLAASDGVEVKVVTYLPKAAASGGAGETGVVVAHGFCGNKQYMQPLSVELVKRGHVVVALDFRGHGSSGGFLEFTREPGGTILLDLEAAVNYLLGRFGVTRLGLVGHSMGGRASLSFADAHPEVVNATVSIGMVMQGVNASRVRNLLVALGPFEQIFSEAAGLEMLRAYTGNPAATRGVTYGDFSSGTAARLVLGAAAEHLFEVLDPKVVGETVAWFEQALAPAQATPGPVALTVPAFVAFLLVSALGLAGLAFAGTSTLSEALAGGNGGGDAGFDGDLAHLAPATSLPRFVLHSLLALLVGGALFLPLANLFEAALPLTMGNYLLGIAAANAAGFGLASVVAAGRRRREGSTPETVAGSAGTGLADRVKRLGDAAGNAWRELVARARGAAGAWRSLLLGLAAGALTTLLLSSVEHWSFSAAFPTTREAGAFLVLLVVFFPLQLLKENWWRRAHDAFRRGGKDQNPSRVREYFQGFAVSVLLECALLVPLALAAWQDERMGFLALSLSVFVEFSIVLQAFTTWAFVCSGGRSGGRSGDWKDAARSRSVLTSAAYYCVVYAWMVLNFFPFGTPASML